MADQRWRTRPTVMPARILERTADRIAEHAAAHRLPAVGVVLHGGEPLLAGADGIARCVRTLRAAAPPGVEVGLRLQTNGMLLDRELLDRLAEWDVRIGVSIDGDRNANDRHRRRPDGAGSYSTVRRALLELNRDRRRDAFSGLLCTVDLENDPIATYEALLEFAPPAVDFLLPHGNWTEPPPGRHPRSPSTPYADWLIALFDRWYDSPRQETRVRIFEEIMNLLLGGHSVVEGLGLDPVTCVVVQTDGAIEQSDMLASAYEGASDTGLHVDRNTFDEALRSPGIAARQSGAAGLSASCRSCDLVRVCGGGLYWHRYRAGSGFANPSVYCPDMYRLITHIRGRLARDVDELRTTVHSNR